MINHITKSADVHEFKQNAVNRYGHNFTTQNFNNHADICYYGCSFTWGQGVDDAERWTSIVDREQNFTSNNFGLMGIGIDEIAVLFKITAQLFQIKKAVILLPPWGRQTMPLAIDWNRPGCVRLNNYLNLGPCFSPISVAEEATRTWFSLPESYYIDRAIISLDLIQYVAQVNNIELFWSSWVTTVYNLLSEPRLPQFINDCQAKDGCHPGPEAHRCFATQVVQAL
jgi:hypothetical protein